MPESSDETSFDCRVERDRGRISVGLAGEIDAYTSERLRAAFCGLDEVAGRHVVVDMSDVRFVDSSGLAALVGALTKVKEQGGVITLASPTPQLVKLFEITGVSRLFPVSD